MRRDVIAKIDVDGEQRVDVEHMVNVDDDKKDLI